MHMPSELHLVYMVSINRSAFELYKTYYSHRHELQLHGTHKHGRPQGGASVGRRPPLENLKKNKKKKEKKKKKKKKKEKKEEKKKKF